MNESNSMNSSRSHMINLQRIQEELDPKDEYIGTDLEGLDAFDRQLRRLCISSEEMQYEICLANLRL